MITVKRIDRRPAFPNEVDWHNGVSVEPRLIGGMELRDYFAAQVMASGVLDLETGITIEQASRVIGIPSEEYDAHVHWPMVAAALAYERADAMMEKRKALKPTSVILDQDGKIIRDTDGYPI